MLQSTLQEMTMAYLGQDSQLTDRLVKTMSVSAGAWLEPLDGELNANVRKTSAEK